MTIKSFFSFRGHGKPIRALECHQLLMEIEKMRPISSLFSNPKVRIFFFGSSSHTVTVHTTSISLNSACKKASFFCKFSVQCYGQQLEACGLDKNLNLGKLIHAKIVISGLEKDSFLTTKLIGFYSSCRDLPIAELVFSRVSDCNVFLMNAMIRAYSVNGFCQKALDLFYQKKEEGFEPDSYTFSCVLKACGSLPDLQQGKKIQSLVLECGFQSDVFVLNSLISMYAKCGNLFEGIHVFERMPARDIVSWNSVISAYVQNGFEWQAMVKVRELIESGLKPDSTTIVSALTMCSSITTAGELHGYSIRNGLELTSVVRNSLISVYGKCGRIKEARWLFDNSIRRDKVAWNAVISCYAQNGYFQESIQLLHEMICVGLESDVITYSGIISSLSQNSQSVGAMRIFAEMLSLELKPDVITIASILPAVSDLQHFNYCKEIHGYCYRNCLESDRRVRNALVSVYSKCGSVENAGCVFAEIHNRDVISWSSMVVGYAQNGYYNEALSIFRQMIRDENEPNPITITSILSSCAGISSLRQGKEIHLWATKNGLEGQTFVGSALIDMYAKCGRIGDSQRVFDLMTDKNLVTWNAMIGGYALHGLAEYALEIFWRLEEPDHVSFLAALSACSHGGLVHEGNDIFNRMTCSGIAPREGHYACMVDILGRVGRLDQALDLVRSMPMEPSADIWGALLGASKMHSNLEIGTYAGEQIIESGCGNSGYYVLLSNILADFGRWEDVEVTRKLMKERGIRKGTGCSWIELDVGVHCFVSREREQHLQWESLSKMMKHLNTQMKGIG